MPAPTTYTEYALQLASDPQAKKDRILGEYVRIAVQYEEHYKPLADVMKMIDDTVDSIEPITQMSIEHASRQSQYPIP